MASPSTLGPLQFINPVRNGVGTFTNFSKLPFELRSMIWEQSLCHERLIKVDLRAGKTVEDLCGEDAKGPLEKKARCRHNCNLRKKDFFIVLRSRHEISKLFRACSESRQAALRFYRVQIPCYYKQRGHSPTEGTFYFHPELDTLHIVGSLMYFAMFADRLWRHDPRRAGLLNLALTGQTTSCHHHYLGFSMRKDHQRDLLRPALKRLRRVTFGFAGIIGRGFPCIQNFAGL